MIEYIGGWIEGATVASRHYGAISSDKTWFSPETAPAWISLLVACFAAYAAWTSSKSARISNNINEYQLKSSRRIEILKVSAENVTDLLILRDQFLLKLVDIKKLLDSDGKENHVDLLEKVANIVLSIGTEIPKMIEANEGASELILAEDAMALTQWDNYVQQCYKKRMQITHLKQAIELNIDRLSIEATSAIKRDEV